MGHHISKSYFEQYVAEARILSGMLKVLYRDSEIKLVLGTVVGAPVAVLRDYLVRSVPFLVSYRKSSGYTVSAPMDSEEMNTKLLSYEQYVNLKNLLFRLRSLLATGSTPKKSRPTAESDEECAICMNSRVEVVLPCSHAFCANCMIGWQEANSTCPSCRQDLSLNAEEEWQLEDWSEADLKEQFDLVTGEIICFLDALPSQSSCDINALKLTHRIVDVHGWDLEQELSEDHNIGEPDLVIDEAKLKPSKFMGV